MAIKKRNNQQGNDPFYVYLDFKLLYNWHNHVPTCIAQETMYQIYTLQAPSNFSRSFGIVRSERA